MTSYIDQTLVFIGSAVVMVPIFNKLGFGSVLGYLIAGVLVGPFGLGFIRDSQSVLHFAELGVVLLLFIIGLEIRPPKLWSMRHELIGLGGVQILSCALFFTGVSLYLGASIEEASIIGLALSLSSTAFAIQTLTERNEFNTEFGRSSFSILLMQDLVAIPALAIIPLLREGAAKEGPSFENISLIISLFIGLLLASRFLIRPIFRIISSTRTREIFTAATLFIVLGVATLMQKVGLSAALGTFIAGVLLADSEYRHELEADLEPFKSLLMGLFFIAVGMGVSLDLIMERPFFIIGLSLLYLLVKGLLIYMSGRIFKMNHENSKMMALSISQGGEFAFVIFGIALGFSLVPERILVFLTAIISLSMALNPLLRIANDKLTVILRKENQGPVYDEIKNESPSVIIAGYGRFGQIFGRALKSQNIPYVGIEHDSEQIELVRRFGIKVYYGDASRLEILEAAGAAKAKYFILAIDDIEVSLATAKIIIEHFPHLKVFARARNRGHAFDLMELGIKQVKRETIDSSMYFVRDLLVEMGYASREATDLIEKFKQHDEIMLQEQFKVRNDDKMFVSVSKQATAQLEEVLRSESSQSYIKM